MLLIGYLLNLLHRLNIGIGEYDMVKYCKELTINTGNYNNMKVKVSECDSWNECNMRLLEGIEKHTNIDMSRCVAEMLGCVEDGEKQKK